MHLDDRQHNFMPVRKSRFPVAEGVGIFVGVVAWDLLSEGYMDIARAILIAAPASLVWFAARCWKDHSSK